MKNKSNAEERLKELVELDRDLQRIQDVDLLLQKVLFHARHFGNADAGTIYTMRDDQLVFSYAQNDTKEKELPRGKKLIYSIFSVKVNEESISGYVAETKKILNIPDVYAIDESEPYKFAKDYDKIAKYKTTSMLTVPLIANNDQVLGVLQLINAKDDEGNNVSFTQEDEIYCLHFATAASMALQRAQLTRQILLRMISMAELRDPKETGPHVNRVAAYSVELYERWAYSQNYSDETIEKQKDVLRMAAMLHDVGKVAISDLILKKPSRFTDEEYEIMKSHASLGADLFAQKQSEFDEVAGQVALSHHENFDGTGYPGRVSPLTGKPIDHEGSGKAEGLIGDEIPIFGRVVALADVYDALSNKRVYKEAWSEERVLEAIRSERGKKFDPQLVDIFFESYEHIKNIQKRYPDPQ